MILPIIDIVKNVVAPIVNRFIPDKTAQDAAIAEIMSATAQVMVEDSKSPDLYIRRARPTFLYVMYVLLLIAIPCGILFIFSPGIGREFTDGAKYWFSSIPDAMYNMLEVCFGVYVGGRTVEKSIKHFKERGGR
jgi:hypothetical protein